MSSLGAKAALRGYRRQALYTLASILQPDKEGLAFQPEGKEDLDVYKEGRLVHAIQVKSYADNLTISSFSPDKPNSFFHRAAKLAQHHDVTIEVVSFGPIGPEIEGAWGGDERNKSSVRAKLCSHGLSDNDVDRLLARLRWTLVEEDTLLDQVFAYLEDSLMGGDPQNAFALLLAWLYVCSENKRKITKLDLISKITAVGRYLAERAAHHQEWFTSIIPLEAEPVTEEVRNELSQEFYQGVAARYAHIVAGVDVPRSDKLLEIDQAFRNEARTVVVHGASGQGKTSVALRFMHDYVPDEWRFFIRFIQDRAHAARVATALAEHLRAVDSTVYVYVDVSSRDLEWPELIRDLLDQRNVRILVTIREEDMARLAVPTVELGFPHTIGLMFNEAEARPIYEQLITRERNWAHTSFEEAWIRFGSEGPLLEFVYFVTHTESLRDRLRSQVRRLCDDVRTGKMTPEELEFLRVCAIASAYQARIEIAPLAAALHLREPIRTLELFKREYLLRRSADNSYVEALHAIRSDILAQELSDPAMASWSKSARLALVYMPESDLESFLLYAFSRRADESEALVGTIEQHRPSTWTGIAAVCRALLWLGIREYLLANLELIDKAHELFDKAWWLSLRYDLAGISPGSRTNIWRLIENIQPSAAEEARVLQARQTPCGDAFRRLSNWLEGQAAPTHPQTSSDWAGFAEVYYWAKHLGIATPVDEAVPDLDLSWPVAHLSLRSLAELIYSLSTGSPDTFDAICGPFQEQILKRFRRETNSIFLEESEETTRPHFIVSLDSLRGNEKQDSAADKSKNILHELAMSRMEIVRLILPDRKFYGVKGHGHRLRILSLPYDPTEKKGVPVENLLPPWPVNANAIFHNLGDWSRRPDNWTDYAEHIVSIRERVIEAFTGLQRQLSKYFSKNKPGVIFKNQVFAVQWDQANKAVQRLPRIPKIAVDEWGFTGEGMADSPREFGHQQNSQPSTGTLALLLRMYRPFLEALRNFFNPLGNFFNQSIDVMAFNSHTGRLIVESERKKLIASLKAKGLNPDLSMLSVHNLADASKALPSFQEIFRQRLVGFVSSDRLARIERRERELFKTVWALWYQFANNPERIWDTADSRSITAMEAALEDLRDAVRSSLPSGSTTGWHSKIVSEKITWEGRPALWISLQVNDPTEIFDAFFDAVQRLEDAFRRVSLNSLEHYVMDQYWPNILIVPSIAGRSLGAGVWRLPAYLFFGNDAVLTPERRWVLIPVPADLQAWVEIGINVVPASMIQPVTELQTFLGELFLIVDHLSDLRNLPQELDEFGTELLQTYLQGRANELPEALKRLVAQWDTVTSSISGEEVLQHHPHLQTAAAVLVSYRNKIFPGDGMDGEVRLNLSGLDQWAEQLQEVMGSIEVVRLLYAANAAETFDERSQCGNAKEH